MNVFRFAGDMMHVLSIVVLLLRLRLMKNAIGIRWVRFGHMGGQSLMNTRNSSLNAHMLYVGRGLGLMLWQCIFPIREIIILISALPSNPTSIRTQELYLIVFVTRYLDLFTTYYSLYNSLMKILYISATSYIVYMVKYTEPWVYLKRLFLLVVGAHLDNG